MHAHASPGAAKATHAAAQAARGEILHWLLVALDYELHHLAACCEQLLVPHVEFLCNAPEALDLPMASMLRIVKCSLRRRRVRREPAATPTAAHRNAAAPPQQQQQQQATVQHAAHQRAPAQGRWIWMYHD